MKTVIGITLFILLLLFGLFAGMMALQAARCEAKWPNHSPRYSYWGGCQVKTDEGYIPATNFRQF